MLVSGSTHGGVSLLLSEAQPASPPFLWMLHSSDGKTAATGSTRRAAHRSSWNTTIENAITRSRADNGHVPSNGLAVGRIIPVTHFALELAATNHTGSQPAPDRRGRVHRLRKYFLPTVRFLTLRLSFVLKSAHTSLSRRIPDKTTRPGSPRNPRDG